MNKLLITFLTTLFCLTSSIGWSLEFKDLVERDGLLYKKFSDVPFTGKTTGLVQGTFNNGKRDGSWILYYKNGQLGTKGVFKNGMSEGSWIYYYKNGQLDSKGDYKNGFQDGYWVRYNKNGQLSSKGNYKNSMEEGYWVYYNKDGTVNKKYTGTYKNGKKISD
jgi:hypothetical protein